MREGGMRAAYFAERTCRWARFRHANPQFSDGQLVQLAPTISRNVCLSSRDFPDDLLPLSLSAIQRCSPSFRQRCPVRQKRHLVLSGVHSPSIRPSIGTENPIPEEMDHREIAVRVPVMNEVQFLFASEPCKPLHPRSLYVVFLVEKDVRVKRQRTCDHLNREEIDWQYKVCTRRTPLSCQLLLRAQRRIC